MGKSSDAMALAAVQMQREDAAMASARASQQQAEQAAREAEARAMAELKSSIGRISGLTGFTVPQAISDYKAYFKDIIPVATAKYEKQLTDFNPDLSKQYTKLAGQLMDQRKMTALNDPTYMQYATGKVPGQFYEPNWAAMQQQYMTYNV